VVAADGAGEDGMTSRNWAIVYIVTAGGLGFYTKEWPGVVWFGLFALLNMVEMIVEAIEQSRR
jgi:hypothetical protein